MHSLHFIVFMYVFTSLHSKKTTRFFDPVMKHLAEDAVEERRYLTLGVYDDVFATPTETVDYLRNQFQVSLTFVKNHQPFLRRTYKIRKTGDQQLVQFFRLVTSLPLRIIAFERAKDLDSKTRFYPVFSAGVKEVKSIPLLRDLAKEVIKTTQRFREQVTKILSKKKEVLQLLSRTREKVMAQTRSVRDRLVEGAVDTDTLRRNKGLYKMVDYLFSLFFKRIFAEEVIEAHEYSETD